MGEPLGPMQRRVLIALGGVPSTEAPPTPRELAERVPETTAGYVQQLLRALHRRGLVERLGKSFTNAWCYRITEAGRTALEKAMSGTTTGDDSE